MERFENIHQEPDAQAIRRDTNIRTEFDALGQRRDVMLGGKVVSLSPEGSIDSATVSFAHFYHCKHPATDPIGSQCAEPGCANISCRACSINSSCLVCLKPLCLEHLELLETPTGTLKFCQRCKTALLRKQRWRNVLHVALSPFVNFNSRKPS